MGSHGPLGPIPWPTSGLPSGLPTGPTGATPLPPLPGVEGLPQEGFAPHLAEALADRTPDRLALPDTTALLLALAEGRLPQDAPQALRLQALTRPSPEQEWAELRELVGDGEAELVAAGGPAGRAWQVAGLLAPPRALPLLGSPFEGSQGGPPPNLAPAQAPTLPWSRVRAQLRSLWD